MRYKFFITILLLVAGCKSNVTQPVIQPSVPKDTLGIHYELLASFTHGQTAMLTGQSDHLFIYGLYGAIKVYDLTARHLTEYPPQMDSITWRWDGAIAFVNNLIYVIADAVSPLTTYPRFYKVVTLNPTTLITSVTSASVPFSSSSDYPAFATYNNKMFVLYSTIDSLYMFDPLTLTGRFVTDNKSKGPQGQKYYSFGVYQNYFYVFRWDSKIFYRINLDTYVWEPIFIPANILSILTGSTIDFPQFVGGILGSKFCLWQALFPSASSNYSSVITYDMKTSSWSMGVFNAANTTFLDPNFYQSDTVLYIADAMTDKLWKLTQLH